jgi:hypothetical protein
MSRISGLMSSIQNSENLIREAQVQKSDDEYELKKGLIENRMLDFLKIDKNALKRMLYTERGKTNE